MSDMLGSIIGSVMSGNTVMPSKSDAASEQRFSDMLKEADKKTTAANLSASVTPPVTAAEKFMKYQQMSAAEKFRASYLAEKGLTEDDLKAMSAEDRAKIEADIAAKIREKMAQSVEKKLASMG